MEPRLTGGEAAHRGRGVEPQLTKGEGCSPDSLGERGGAPAHRGGGGALIHMGRGWRSDSPGERGGALTQCFG